MTLILRLLFNALGLVLISKFIPGIVVDNFYVALVAAVILGILNTVIRPILLILTLPITILTLGLFSFVLNGLLFMFVASFIEGFKVNGFLTALIGSILMSIISTIGNSWINNDHPVKTVEYREIRD